MGLVEYGALFDEPPEHRAPVRRVEGFSESSVDLSGFKQGSLTLLAGIGSIIHSILRGRAQGAISVNR